MTACCKSTHSRSAWHAFRGSAALVCIGMLCAIMATPAHARDERLSGKPGPKREMNCNITERVKNKNRSTTCVYKCPDGGTESASVDEGFSCPAVVNVLRK
ncbi:MAG: hypothetical protein RIR28_687 [Pseudomonadota bacterium]|jgi:hypothetical protein